MVATSLTIGIGGSGGVFAPSLFIGAMLGAAFGQAAPPSCPASPGAAGAYALVGMGAVFAGAARAPITAVLILFELTGEYSIILPLMAAVVLATGISHLLIRETVYTAKLLRRGIDLDAPAPSWAHARSVRSVVAAGGRVLTPGTTLEQASEALRASRDGELPVVDAGRRPLGVLTATALPTGSPGPRATARVADLVEVRPTVAAGATVADALDVLDRHDVRGVAVVDDGRFAGWFTARAVLDRVRAGADPATG